MQIHPLVSGVVLHKTNIKFKKKDIFFPGMLVVLRLGFLLSLDFHDSFKAGKNLLN